MFCRIARLTTIDPLILDVTFDDGQRVRYDVAEDVAQIPAFAPLTETPGLFACARLDPSRTCVSWTDMIDLPSDTIYEYGKPAVP